MSYSPHTWVNNETITYQKLNNIEEGIQNAVSSVQGMAGLLLVPYGFTANSSHVLGYIGYYKQIGGKWCLVSEYTDIYWYDNNIVSYGLIAPPGGSNIKVFWAVYAPLLNSIDLVNFSGEINSTPITVYSSDGVNAFNGYELTGTGYVEAVAV